jgi:Zn-dependent protease with chaperone function
MGIGVSIFLLAVGAILTFAVNASASGFNLDTVGIILMLAGALGLLLTLVFWSSFSPWSRRRRQVIDRSYDGDRVVEERRIRRDVP